MKNNKINNEYDRVCLGYMDKEDFDKIGVNGCFVITNILDKEYCLISKKDLDLMRKN